MIKLISRFASRCLFSSRTDIFFRSIFSDAKAKWFDTLVSGDDSQNYNENG